MTVSIITEISGVMSTLTVKEMFHQDYRVFPVL